MDNTLYDSNGKDEIAEKTIDELLDDPDLVNPNEERNPEDGWLSAMSGQELQDQMLAHILNDAATLACAAQHLNPSAFTVKSHKGAAKLAIQYYLDYGKVPPEKLLKALFAESVKGQKDAAIQMAQVGSIAYLPCECPEFWQDKIREFAQRHHIGKAQTAFLKGECDVATYFILNDKAREIGKASTEYILRTDEELDDLTGLEWQIAGHFPKDGTVVVFGSSGAGKSFYCLDMAYSIAAGVPFLGVHDVIQGNVLYICSEGAYGLKGRCAAWKKHHGIGKVPGICFSTVSHNLQDRAEVEQLIKKATSKLGKIDVVFVDTLSRNFGGGDIDKNHDMQGYLANGDYIREALKATVVHIHHTGWAETTRERGAKSLRDYSDTSIAVAKSGETEIEIKCAKQKDAAEFAPYMLVKNLADGSLYLTLAGDKAEIADTEKFDKLISVIPVVALDATPDDANTITASEIRDQTGISNGEVSKRIKELISRNVICRTERTDARSPYRYFRYDEISS